MAQDSALTGENCMAQDSALTGENCMAQDSALTGENYMAQDSEVTGDSCVAQDSALTGENCVAQDSEVTGENCVAQDSEVTGENCVAQDSEVTGENCVAQDSEVTGENCVAQDSEVTGENCVAQDLIAEKRSGQWIDDNVDKFEKRIDGVGWKNVEPAIAGTLQPPNAAHDLLDEVPCIGSGSSEKTHILEENQIQQETSGEPSSWLPVEHGPSTDYKGDSGHQAPQRVGEQGSEPAAQDLQDMVFESVARIRRHTAPDSESDDEELGRLRANGVTAPGRSKESELPSPGNPADTGITCSRTEGSDEAAATTDAAGGRSGSRRENTDGRQLAGAGTRTHALQEAGGGASPAREGFRKELWEDQCDSQPGGGDVAAASLLEPPGGAGSRECAEAIGSDGAGGSDAECTGEVQ
ncbi:uncharacterized protein LOC144672577 [Cetorhinus maximus]